MDRQYVCGKGHTNGHVRQIIVLICMIIFLPRLKKIMSIHCHILYYSIASLDNVLVGRELLDEGERVRERHTGHSLHRGGLIVINRKGIGKFLFIGKKRPRKSGGTMKNEKKIPAGKKN